MLSESFNGAALPDQLTPTFLRSLPRRPHHSDLDTHHPLSVGTNALLESQTLPDHPSLTRHRPLPSSILTNRSRLAAPICGLQRKRLSTRQMRFGSKRNGKSLKDDPIRSLEVRPSQGQFELRRQTEKGIEETYARSRRILWMSLFALRIFKASLSLSWGEARGLEEISL